MEMNLRAVRMCSCWYGCSDPYCESAFNRLTEKISISDVRVGDVIVESVPSRGSTQAKLVVAGLSAKHDSIVVGATALTKHQSSYRVLIIFGAFIIDHDERVFN